MKLKSIFILSLLALSFFPVILSSSAPDNTNSKILVSNTVNANTALNISVWVADSTNSSISDANVTITVDNGYFSDITTISAEGQSNVNGFFNATWTTPNVPYTLSEIQTTITANITSSGTSIEISKSVTVKHLNTDSISNSVFSHNDKAIANLTTEFTVQVLDIHNNPVPDLQVTFIADEGEFTTDAIGSSDTNGYFKATWRAPILDGIDQLIVNLHANINASAEIGISISSEITVTTTISNNLSFENINPSKLKEKSETNISIRIMDDVYPAEGALVQISSDDGLFSNNDQSIDLTANSTGYVDVDWTAPDVSDNVTIGFAVYAEFRDINGTYDFNIDVYVSMGYLNANISIAKTEIWQNETLPISVTVFDNATNNPVVGIPVIFGLDMGYWQNGEQAISIDTDSNGIATALFNATSTIFLFDINKINVSVSIADPEYNLLELSTSFTLHRIVVYDMTIKTSAVEINAGESVNFTITAYQNDVPLPEATIDLVATGGLFENGAAEFRDRTGADGTLSIIWSSDILKDITDTLVIYISIEFVNSGLPLHTVNITLQPIITGTPSSTTAGGLSGLSGNTAAIISAIVAIIALAGGAIIFKLKR